MTATKTYPIKPLKDNLLLLALDEAPKEEITKNGVIIPAKKPKLGGYRKGIVLDKGPGLTTEMDNGNCRIPDWVKPDMMMIFSVASGMDINFDGKHYVIVSWRSCEAMLNPEYEI